MAGQFLRLNNRGVGALALVTGISVAGVITFATISQMSLNNFRRSAFAYSEWETNLVNQKAISLGGFFVAHNLVLCREDGWSDLGKDKKCRWGGTYHTPKILASKFKVTEEGYDNGALVLNIKSSTEGEDEVIETKLKMDLVNWFEDKELEALVGTVPVKKAASDDDNFMVLMNAETELVLSDNTNRTISKSGAVRRPIATPNLTVVSNTGKESCIFECATGDVLTPYPECRGALNPPAVGGDAAVVVKMENFGPGAIYKLKYERTTKFNQGVYPGTADETSVVDVLNREEVFMPGEERESELVRKCYAPVNTFTVQNVDQVTSGSGWLDNMIANNPNNVGALLGGTIVETSSTTTSTVNVASSFRALSSEHFNISAAKFDPLKAEKIADFEKIYNPRNPSSYPENKSKSEIEPKRLGTSLPDVAVGSSQETVTQTTTLIRRRTVQFVSSDGDGDGDGDN